MKNITKILLAIFLINIATAFFIFGMFYLDHEFDQPRSGRILANEPMDNTNVYVIALKDGNVLRLAYQDTIEVYSYVDIYENFFTDDITIKINK